VNRGQPQDLKQESKSLKHDETTFRRKEDILQPCRDTRVASMISTVHKSMVDVQRRYGHAQKKPICISQYITFMKGVDRADHYLDSYSLPRKTVKWTKKVALWLINCALFNSYSAHKILNPGTNLQYKEFLMLVAQAWSTDQMAAADTDLVQLGPSTATLRRPHVDPPG
jgi:hypothetical protein